MVAPLVARALTKHFGSRVALSALDLEVGPGEVFGYLGPNGAGKTTTIRLALGVLFPTSGTVTILGGEPSDPELRQRVGFLPAELRFDDRATVHELMAFWAQLRSGHDRRLAVDLLERFDLDPTRRVRELSTGNRRKIGIVQAFVHRPELLVLDEPTSGLDPLLQQEFHALLREAVAAGASALMSSHSLAEVDALAHRVGVLRDGHLVDVTTIEDLHRASRQRIELHGTDASAAAFDGVPGVVSCTGGSEIIELVVEGDVGPALAVAGGFRVGHLVVPDTDLEDVFFEHYRTQA